ncbi:MAG: hypothetical protein VXW22_04375 [Pseudomonadota bacterium]|nr:hypothetical protein [Pseudomonadota bacterium]
MFRLIGLSVTTIAFFSTVCIADGGVSDEYPELCDALFALTDDVKSKQLTRTVTVSKDHPIEVACIFDPEDATQQEFCDAVLRNVSMEFTHAYPWQLTNCLIQNGIKPTVQTVNEYTGLVDRDKIVRLTAALANGVQVTVVFNPKSSEDSNGVSDRYWGRYVLDISVE